MKIPVPEVTIEEKGRPNQSAPARPGQALDDVDPFEEEDQESPGSPRTTTRTSLLLLFISICTLGSGAAFGMLSELLLEYGTLASKASPAELERPDFGNADAVRAWQEEQKSRTERRKFGRETLASGYSLHNFSVVIWAIGLGILITGLALALPRFRSGKGLIIGSLCVAAVGLLLVLIVRVIPIITNERVADHFVFAADARFATRTGTAILSLLLDLAPVISLGLLAGAFLGLAMIEQSVPLRRKLVLSCWWIGGWGIALVVFYIWVMIVGRQSSSVLQYLTWIAHWGMNIALGIGLYFSGRFLFRMRSNLRPVR